jgi:hypothetical protein
VRASSPLLVAKAATEDAVASVGVVVADVVLGVGIVGRLAVGVRVVVPGMRRQQHPTWHIHEAAVAGSRPGAVGAGTPLGPERCRVPYWRDALPWRRRSG